MLRTFELLSTDSSARRGRYNTAHGSFQTPNFMPVGTKASVKGVDCERLKELGAEITLVNTYHLWLRPGAPLIARLGGVHTFSGWKGPILSDSGGFQIFSLRGIRTLSEEGVEFRSHLDGSKRFLSPEGSIGIQEELGVDIAMVLDECPSPELPKDAVARSLEMTLRWAARSLQARRRESTAVFGITQGGMHRDLRKHSAQALSELPFDGMAIGGLSVGEPKDVMYEVLSWHVDHLPATKIRYLMGVGTPEDIIEAVRRGVDLFDCVMPTRAGRFGRAFVRGEQPQINIKNAEHAVSAEPLDATCRCVACRNYSRGYLHHLFKNDEMLGPQLLSVHNLTHYLDHMASIRRAIEESRFEQLYHAEKLRWRSVVETDGEASER